MSNFKNVMIGKVDCNDKQLREGDKIEILVSKKSANNANDVIHKGIIIYSYTLMGFAIHMEDGKENLLGNYASYCQFKKVL